MKQIINALASIAGYFRHSSFFLLVFLVLSLSSCFRQYYQTNTVHATDSAAMSNLRKESKHFIVHTPSGPFGLKVVKLSSENISGEKDFLNPNNDRLLNPLGERKNPMSRAEKKVCTTEVHLYTDSYFENNNVLLTYNQINRMDVYGLDKKAIRGSRIAGIIVITLGVAAIIGISAAAVNSMTWYY